MDLVLSVIIGCEIAFWVVVALGLLARYGWRRRRLGAVLLAATPVIDVVLLVAVVVDLERGGTATFFHGLAALYLGLSLAHGPAMIRWADTRVAHRFAGGPPPVKLYGWAYARGCWKDVARTTLAVGIAAGVLGLLTVLVQDAERTEPLLSVLPLLGIWWVVDLLWALGHTVWPRRPAAAG
ncbi:hypothetical protein I601_1802 [Nocardioides dokdonensis FR1436]|uniref:Membrane protein YmcC n=1 Tax=Nocardioides dokdonensis FR1436 TaxID=1300347 RepID=A0A1A9GKX0_9ACTN|nr:hypothetical protein [Nocardioides dokdonensis]ANH38233.1 hypothetical protein I601_1802 [Nocardioides dokdonensis FR1436]